jgi:hypothetical protein
MSSDRDTKQIWEGSVVAVDIPLLIAMAFLGRVSLHYRDGALGRSTRSLHRAII